MLLTSEEQTWLGGHSGAAMQLAMRLIVAAGEATGAARLVPVEMAHINSCHYSGQLSLDFAEFLLANDACLAVPTHTNASLISMESPDLRPIAATPTEVSGAKRLMEIYEQLGCSQMWSCAPYQQLVGRPRFGAHVIGSESNAVSFFNSVLGARTNKYGDLLDVAGAIAGRVPLSGLHTDDARLATHVFRLDPHIAADATANATFPHVLGILLGERSNGAVPVVDGLAVDRIDEDVLKAIAAGGATSGSVDMFHIVGVTPEAPSLAAALGGRVALDETIIDSEMVRETQHRLSRGDGPLRSVCLGTPHYSIGEFERLRSEFDGRQVDNSIYFLVTTSRAVAKELADRGWDDELRELGVTIATDTCSYYPPQVSGMHGLVMTDSAKWAYYAPGILDVAVRFASVADCVESAVSGAVMAS